MSVCETVSTYEYVCVCARPGVNPTVSMCSGVCVYTSVCVSVCLCPHLSMSPLPPNMLTLQLFSSRWPAASGSDWQGVQRLGLRFIQLETRNPGDLRYWAVEG